MKITLTNRDAQRMLGALKSVDAGGDVKLDVQTRIHVGLNIKRMFPVVATFEEASSRRQLDYKNGPEHVEANKAIQREILELPNAIQDYNLFQITLANLKLDENTKITGDQIAALSPIISDLESEASKAA